MKAQVVVIGGGITGVSTALHAAQRTDPLHPVVLLERKDLAAGSTGRSGAILRTYYAHAELASMARDSLRVYKGFLGRTGRRIGFRGTGVVTLARGEAVDELRGHVEMMRGLAIDVRILEGDEILEVCPGAQLGPGTVAAYEPDGGTVNPIETVVSMAALAREAGAVTRTGTQVEEILVESGRVVGVRTSQGDFETSRVLVAAGPWSKPLLDAVGCELPLRPVAPEQHFVELPTGRIEEEEIGPASAEDELDEIDPLDVESRFGGPTNLPDPHPVILDLEQGFYAKCERRRGRCRVGALSVENDRPLEDPDTVDDHAVSTEFSSWAREKLVHRMPEYSTFDDAGTELGIYTLTPDYQAVLGPVPGVEGLFVAAGFSGHGFKLGPSIGEGMAQMMFDQPVSGFKETFFSLERFAGGRASGTDTDFGL